MMSPNVTDKRFSRWRLLWLWWIWLKPIKRPVTTGTVQASSCQTDISYDHVLCVSDGEYSHTRAWGGALCLQTGHDSRPAGQITNGGRSINSSHCVETVHLHTVRLHISTCWYLPLQSETSTTPCCRPVLTDLTKFSWYLSGTTWNNGSLSVVQLR